MDEYFSSGIAASSVIAFQIEIEISRIFTLERTEVKIPQELALSK